MKKAVELKPYLLGAIKNLAKIYFNQKEFEKAVPLLRKALKIVPFDYEVKFLLEDAQRKKLIRGEEFKPKITKDIVDDVELEYKYIFTANIREIMSAVNEYALTLIRSGQLKAGRKIIRRAYSKKDPFSIIIFPNIKAATREKGVCTGCNQHTPNSHKSIITCRDQRFISYGKIE